MGRLITEHTRVRDQTTLERATDRLIFPGLHQFQNTFWILENPVNHLRD